MESACRQPTHREASPIAADARVSSRLNAKAPRIVKAIDRAKYCKEMIRVDARNWQGGCELVHEYRYVIGASGSVPSGRSSHNFPALIECTNWMAHVSSREAAGCNYKCRGVEEAVVN